MNKGFYLKSVIYNQPVDNKFTLSLCERRTTCLRPYYWPLSGGQKQNQKPTGQQENSHHFQWL